MKISDRAVPEAVYAFGPFVLDTAARRLTRDGQAIALTSKAFDTLVALVANAGRTLDKSELLGLVWPDTAVEENNLTQAVSRLRKALGDGGDVHAFIVTQPGKGYRFVAPVRQPATAPTTTLATQLAAGALRPAEALRIAIAVLDRLDALHRAGRVHAALTPASLRLCGDDVLMDEGDSSDDADDIESLGRRAPEHLEGAPPDVRSHLFSVGALLYEMLSGQPPFPGDSAAEVRRAVLTRTPPALGGAPAMAIINRIVLRALARPRDERYASARDMARELREARLSLSTAGDVTVRLRPRVVVLPFRVLRPDPETDFLAFSLPDVIITSLSGLDSLVVRSTLTSTRFAGETPDLASLATEAQADMVLSGTLLRDGDQVRVNTQLADTTSGTVIWSRLSQAPLGGIFGLHDELTSRIVASLPRSLTARDQYLLAQNVPATPHAFELYLRANQLSYDPRHWTVARDLYEQCVREDPAYAPAWARLGRVYRVLGAYGKRDRDENYRLAKEAFKRALTLNFDLPVAHHLYTMLEVELGQAETAMLRLLERAAVSSPDAELFAGLVHACRYCGLLEASVAAYHAARRLDPAIRTSVAHAYLMLGDYDKAIETDVERPPFAAVAALIEKGCDTEAIARLKEIETLELPASMHNYSVALRSLVERRSEDTAIACRRMVEHDTVTDPCGRFYGARLIAACGDTDRALAELESVVASGFYCASFLVRDKWLSGLHGSAKFDEIVRAAERRNRSARAAFVSAGGETLLGLSLQ